MTPPLIPNYYLHRYPDGKKRKAQLEDGYHDAGYRSGTQVLCNSFSAFVATGLWCIAFAHDALPWSLVASYTQPGLTLVENVPYNDGEWCPLDVSISNGSSRALIFATLG